MSVVLHVTTLNWRFQTMLPLVQELKTHLEQETHPHWQMWVITLILPEKGGVPTLEMQILVPIQEHNEFNTNILTIADRLNEDDEYVQMSLNAYDRVPNPYVITRAIATFERTLVSGNSSYDQNLRGESSLSASALRGLALFFSDKTNCSTCHAGFNFTNYTFENNGLYEEYEDVGRFRLTRDSADLSVFKVPSLRKC